MQTVILAGGQGTRLREETEIKPKPMVQIGPHPMLWHIMKIYSHHGHNEFVVLLGYKGEVIKDYFLRYDLLNHDLTVEFGPETKVTPHGATGEYGWRTTLVDTGIRANTGARIKRARRYIDTDPFFLTYGDGVADIDLQALLRFHERQGRVATVTGVAPPSRFGELIVGPDGRAVEFSEKPRPTGNVFVNGGFFVLSHRIFDYLDEDDGCIFEREPMRRLVEDGELAVYPHLGYWQCMDTLRDVRVLNAEWESGRAPWRVWDRARRG